MKKFFIALCVFIFSAVTVHADEILINTSTATDAELVNAIQQLQEEQANRYKINLANQQIDADVDGITFRGIPWYTPLSEVEEAIGEVARYKSAGDLYRIGYIDSESSFSSSDVIEGDLGCNPGYSGLKVAGYQPSSTRVRCIFPIVDGQIVRDISVAQIYMGYYTFEDEDFGDLIKVYDDLAEKLRKLYGSGVEAEASYYTSLTWIDTEGNYIRLRINSSTTYMTLAYVAATADQRLDEMSVVYMNEKTMADDALRNENVNNTDGL